MTVRVELRKIKRAWRDSDHDSVLMVFLPETASSSDALLSAVTSAALSANRRAESVDGATEFACTEAWPGVRGPVIHTTIADSASAMERWMHAFTGELEDAGWEGVLTAEKERYPAMKSRNVVATTAVLALSGWVPTEDGGSTPGWVDDPDLRGRIVDWALSWTAQGEDHLYLGLGLSMFRVPLAAAAERLTSSAPAELINSPDVDHVRSVCLDRSGHLLVQLRDSDATWQERLETLTGVVADFADVTEFGLVRHAYAGVVNVPSIFAYPPRLPDTYSQDSPVGYYHRQRFLDTTFVPDACGVQVVGDAHLERTRDLSDWTVTQITEGKHLVQARDPAAWFATDQPDSDIVEKARRDFGEVILRGRPPLQHGPDA